MTYKKDGIEYKTPEVYLLDNTNMLFAEFFARTAYDSYDKSENSEILELQEHIENHKELDTILANIKTNKAPSSDLLTQLSHVYFHESTLEHISFNIFIKGVSRALLQEIVRHRLSAYTVRSTRYTMTNIIHMFLCAVEFSENKDEAKDIFVQYILNEDFYTISDVAYIELEASMMFEKLLYQASTVGKEEFRKLIVPKSLMDSFDNAKDISEALSILKSKVKRNLGDPFKHVVSENFRVDLGMSINLRSLKNMFDLRLNASAWFQFQVLMNEIFKVIPESYMKLINNGKFDGIQGKIENQIQAGLYD